MFFRCYQGFQYFRVIKGALRQLQQVQGTTRCVTISMKYYALTGLERFNRYAQVWMSWEF